MKMEKALRPWSFVFLDTINIKIILIYRGSFQVCKHPLIHKVVGSKVCLVKART